MFGCGPCHNKWCGWRQIALSEGSDFHYQMVFVKIWFRMASTMWALGLADCASWSQVCLWLCWLQVYSCCSVNTTYIRLAQLILPAQPLYKCHLDSINVFGPILTATKRPTDGKMRWKYWQLACRLSTAGCISDNIFIFSHLWHLLSEHRSEQTQNLRSCLCSLSTYFFSSIPHPAFKKNSQLHIS